MFVEVAQRGWAEAETEAGDNTCLYSTDGSMV